jgi:hypothetical protein
MKIILKREFYLSEWKEVKEELLNYFSVLERIDTKEKELKKLLRNKIVRNVESCPGFTSGEPKSRCKRRK